MEVREELKEIIERARAAAEAAGELPPGEYAPVQLSLIHISEPTRP